MKGKAVRTFGLYFSVTTLAASRSVGSILTKTSVLSEVTDDNEDQTLWSLRVMMVLLAAKKVGLWMFTKRRREEFKALRVVKFNILWAGEDDLITVKFSLYFDTFRM